MMKRWMLIALTGAALSCGGTDSGAPVISAGDAGMISDGTSDAGSNAPDAGPTSSVNGCTASKYVDATAAGASRAVAFTFFKYSPDPVLKERFQRIEQWVDELPVHASQKRRRS